MDIRQLVQLVRRGLLIVVVTTVVGGLAGFTGTLFIPPTFEARATLIAPAMASTFAEVAQSRPVLEHVIAASGLSVDPDDLARDVDARPSQTSAVLTIVVRHRDASRAAGLANSIAQRLIDLAPDISGSSAEALEDIQRDLARVQDEIDRIEGAIAALTEKAELTAEELALLRASREQLASLLGVRASLQSVAIAYSESVLSMLGPATPPERPSSPNPMLSTAVGGLVGLAIGLVAVLFPAIAVSGRVRRLAEPAWRDPGPSVG